ncbi:hypothetical protein Pla22_46290 [Rubripirellula amarantea]|uniref:Uncharacterized protein n=1 Tax=Rubripirellula amarantea TaxID=2527999 RepID=A0A5C5WHF7_9BACT|nr:hypothetical protein Pla22_46290 [Rubripirellula amarantea]
MFDLHWSVDPDEPSVHDDTFLNIGESEFALGLVSAMVEEDISATIRQESQKTPGFHCTRK